MRLTSLYLRWLSEILYRIRFVHLVLLTRKIFRRYGIYILSYHHVVKGEPDELGRRVTATRFEGQLAFLKEWFEIVSMEKALKLLENGPLDRDYVVITFDDGYVDNYEVAFPILRNYEIPATIFVITGLAGTHQIPWYDECRTYLRSLANTNVPPTCSEELEAIFHQLHRIMRGRQGTALRLESATDFLKTIDEKSRKATLVIMRTHLRDAYPNSRGSKLMSWDHAREMRAHGITFGSHTVSHPILRKLKPKELDEELRASKEMIEQQLDSPCELFAFPNGDFCKQVIESLKATGYRSACTQIYGKNRPGSDPLKLRRIGVGNIACSVLALKLSGLLAPIFYLRGLWRARHVHSSSLPTL